MRPSINRLAQARIEGIIIMKLFVSYRRNDAGGWAQSIATAMRREFGSANVFVDVDSIKNYDDFERVILSAIDQADVFLAVIGPHWLMDQNEVGKRSLDDEADYVRREIAAAFNREVWVVPVLVEGATMPATDQLPAELRSLARPFYFEARPERWEKDIAEIMNRIRPNSRYYRRFAIGVGLVALAIGLTGGFFVSLLTQRLRLRPSASYDSFSSSKGIGDHLL
jgi:hypothetical protein